MTITTKMMITPLMIQVSSMMTLHCPHLMTIVLTVIHPMTMIRSLSTKGGQEDSSIYSEMPARHWLQRENLPIIISASTAQKLLLTCSSAINWATRLIIMNVRIVKRIFLREWSTISFASLVTDLSAISTGLKNVSSPLKTQ
jgi:hypothetical protein